MEDWPQHYTNKQVQVLVKTVNDLNEQVKRLSKEIASLDKRKADRRGRKPTQSTSDWDGM